MAMMMVMMMKMMIMVMIMTMRMMTRVMTIMMLMMMTMVMLMMTVLKMTAFIIGTIKRIEDDEDDDDGGDDDVVDDAHRCHHRHPRRLHNIDFGGLGRVEVSPNLFHQPTGPSDLSCLRVPLSC
jgi:hypothetical protein